MSNIDISKPSAQFYEYVESLKAINEVSQFKGIDFYLEKFNLFKSIIDILPSIVYIVDYRTRKYLYMSENIKDIFGYTAEETIAAGQSLIFSRVHPDDIAVFTSKIFGEFVDYSRTVTDEDIKKTVFSLNVRFKRKDDVYIQFLQQYVVLERDEFNNPLMTLGLATDITAYKTDNRMIFSVTKYKPSGRELKIYSPHALPVSHIISKRETEILKLLLKGCTSKKIAETLHLSYYTVRAHRRRLLEKTNCKNSTELGNYAIVNGLV
jgi:DNA-binding CsgD family transcriptional regulator